MAPRQRIGILGGSGPLATLRCHARVLELARTEHDAVEDSDYPDLLIHNVALRGFDATGSGPGSRAEAVHVADNLRRLADAGADLCVIACNTLHSAPVADLGIPVVDLIEAVADHAAAHASDPVGLITSRGARRRRLYEETLAARTLRSVSTTDEEQDLVDAAIEASMAGRFDPTALDCVVDGLRHRGARAVLFGCTELYPSPLIADAIDSVDVLARTVVTATYSKVHHALPRRRN